MRRVVYPFALCFGHKCDASMACVTLQVYTVTRRATVDYHQASREVCLLVLNVLDTCKEMNQTSVFRCAGIQMGVFAQELCVLSSRTL